MPFDKNFFGFNAIAAEGRVGDERIYLETCKRMESEFQQVVSNNKLATKLYDFCEGGTEVIHRSFSTGDNRFWDKNSSHFIPAKQYIDELTAEKDKRLTLSISNEPNPDFTDREDVIRCVNWHTDAARYAGDKQVKFVVGNFAAGGGGGIYKGHIESGVWDGFIDAMWDYRESSWVGIHEYAHLMLPMTWALQNTQDPERFWDPNNMQPEDWLYLNNQISDTILQPYDEESIYWFSHLFRFSWLQHRAIEKGKPLEFVITEFGVDKMPDKQREGDDYEYWKAKLNYPHPDPFDSHEYDSPHGFYANAPIYKHVWKNWSISRAIFEQLKWYERNTLREWVKGALIFSWGYDGDSPEKFIYRGFNVASDQPLHEMLIEHHQAQKSYIEPDVEEQELEDRPRGIQMKKPVDMLPYFIGGNKSPHELHLSWTGFRENIHVKVNPDTPNNFFLLKGHLYNGVERLKANWEQFAYDNHFILRGFDVSPGDDQVYFIEGGGYAGFSPWIHRYMVPGEVFYITSNVTFLYDHNGKNVPNKPPYRFDHSIELHALHDTYEFENTGVVLRNVAEFWGRDDAGKLFEKYWFAIGFGLVGWWNSEGKQSQINRVSVPGSVVPKTFDWMSVPILPQEDPIDPIMIDVNDPRWTPAMMVSPYNPNVNIRIRALHTLNSKTMGYYKDKKIVEYIPEFYGEGKGVEGIDDKSFRWHPIRFIDSEGDSIVGWVRQDVVGNFIELAEEEPQEEQPEEDDTLPTKPEEEVDQGEEVEEEVEQPTKNARITYPITFPSAEAFVSQASMDKVAKHLEHYKLELELYRPDFEEKQQLIDLLEYNINILRNHKKILKETEGLSIIYESMQDAEGV